MYYKRKSTLKRPATRTFKVNAFGGYATGVGENVLNLGKSKYCLNYVARDGELTNTYGTRSTWLKFPGSADFPLPKFSAPIIGVYQYKRNVDGTPDDRLIVHLINGELYTVLVDQDKRTPQLLYTPFSYIYGAYSYRLGQSDVLLIASGSGFYVLDDTKLTKVEDAPEINRFCIHSERAFAVCGNEPYRLWFSSNLDPSDWTISADGGGYIEFSKESGALKEVVSFFGYLYVFREYGIERITTYADQSEFEVRCVYKSTDRIYENTVAVCGDKILFLSEKGLHAFDGINVTKISGVIEPEDFTTRGLDSVATYYKGTYFLSTYIERFDDDEYHHSPPYVTKNNVIICLSLDDGVVSVMSEYDIARFCVYKSDNGSNLIMVLNHQSQEHFKLCMLDETEGGRMGSVTYYNWQTGMTDMGYPEKKKILKDVTFAVSGTVAVYILLDDLVLPIGRVTDTEKTIRVNRPFLRFGFRLTGYGDSIQRISPPVVRVDMR